MKMFGTPVEYFPPIVTLLHFGIAGLGWYFLLRVLGIRPLIALLGGVNGATSGFSLILSQVWIFIAATFAWIPWILLGLVGSIRHEPTKRHQIALVVGLCSSLLIGYPQLGVYSWLFAAWFALVWAYCVVGSLRRLLRPCCAAIGAGLLAAPAWLPGLYFFLDSARTNRWRIEDYNAGSLFPGVALLDWLLPSFAYPNLYGGLHSAYGYQGAWLVPALFGAFLVSYRYRGSAGPPPESEKDLWRQMKAALACGLLLYLLALGKYAKLTTLLYGIPVLSSFRNPYKFLPFFLATFLIAAACALEICWKHSSEFRRYRGWFLATAGTLIAAWATNEWLARKLIARHPEEFRLPGLPVSLGCTILGVAILVVCLYRSRWLIALVPVQIVLVVSLCNQANMRTYQLGSMRVKVERMGISEDYSVLPLSNFRSSEIFESPHMGEYGLFHTATLNNYYSATGCAAPSMLPKWYLRWLPSNEYGLLAGGSDSNKERVGTNLLRSYNIRYYVVAKNDLNNRKIVQETPGLSLVSEQTETLVYEDRGALPRLWFASGVRRYSESSLEQALLHNQEPPTVAFVEGEVPGSSDVGRVVATSWSANAVRVLLEAPKPAFLVVAVTWYPGWRGLLDDKPAAIQRVNGTLLGVSVPAGARELKLEYRTSGLTAAVGLEIVGIAFVVITCSFGARRSRFSVRKSYCKGSL